MSTISGGDRNIASATLATVPGGKYGKASNYGQQAYASGAFAAAGDAQSSTFILRRATTSSTTAELFLDGASARMLIASGATWTFDILISARSSTGNSGGYRVLGVIENNSGTTAIVGSVVKTVVAEDIAAWDVSVIADNTADALIINVNGDATNVRWVATVRTSEVSQ